MGQIILVLTQSTENGSITQLTRGLAERNQFKVLVCGIGQVSLNGDQIACGSILIPLKKINLVIKRTWGPIRTRALELCQALAAQGIPVLNGCNFIAWSHSKVTQYNSLKNLNIIPESIVFNLDDQDVTSKLSVLGFRLVVKTDQGCRTDGVYLVENKDELERLLLDLKQENNGPLLAQKYIPSSSDETSRYYRVNVVGGKAHSAVCFELRWKYVNKYYKKLSDSDHANDKVVPLDFFDPIQLQNIIDACPYHMDVVGLDIMVKGKELFLLEYNDGPNIDLTEDLGKKDGSISHQQFSAAIAQHCISLALIDYLRKLPTFSNSITADTTIHEIADNPDYSYRVGPLADGSQIVVKQPRSHPPSKPTSTPMLYDLNFFILFRALNKCPPERHYADYDMRLIVTNCDQKTEDTLESADANEKKFSAN